MKERDDRPRTYIIAEIGPNHNGSVKLAKELIRKVALGGVDAVKFQIYIPEALYSKDAFKARYQRENDKSASPIEMSRAHHLSFEDHERLYQACKENNVDYLCSAFDMESLLFIDKHFDMPYFKIPSGEIFTIDMMEYIAKRQRAVILSTGMATYDEVGKALGILNKYSKKDVTILHCVSNYPAPPEDVNLLVMAGLRKRFGYPVGFSDHTVGNECAIAAVALGAVMIEKHVTLDRNMPGPDHKASATVEEFAELVKSIRNVEKAIGSDRKVFSDAELEIKSIARKSIATRRGLQAGETITEDAICYKRPGLGISPLKKSAVIGRKTRKALAADTVIRDEDIC